MTYSFGGNRIKALERDNYKCVKCGMTRDEHFLRWDRDITVDHIDGNGRNVDKPNNKLNNLQTLCLTCHGKKDIKRKVKKWNCSKGHEFTKENTYIWHCIRYCKICQRERNRKQKKILGMDKKDYMRIYSQDYYKRKFINHFLKQL